MSGAWKIECICDDKHLADVLRALAAAKVVMTGPPIPVVGAEVKQGVAHASGEHPNAAVNLISDYTKKNKMTTISRRDITAILTTAGMSKGYTSKATERAVDAGVLKKLSRGTYEVL